MTTETRKIPKVIKRTQLLLLFDKLYDYVLEQDPTKTGLLIYHKPDDVAQLTEIVLEYMKTRPGAEDLQGEITRQDEVIVAQQAEIERLKALNEVLVQPASVLGSAANAAVTREAQSQLDEIATALRFCPECKILLEKFCQQYQHRTAESVIREALGGWFHHWPHWRGCPSTSEEGA